MNLKNVIENLAITIVATFAGALMGYYISINVAEIMIEAQSETIRIAIQKETTAIHNTLNNTFKKIKKSDDLIIRIEPENNSAIINNKDTTKVKSKEKKKGLFKRLFNKKSK